VPDNNSTVALDYATGISRRRRIVRRALRIASLFILLASAATSPRWVPPAWHRAQLIYHQRQCLNYSAPPDQIVYDSDHPGSGGAFEFPVCLKNFEKMVPMAGPSTGPLGWQSVSGRAFSNTPYISFLHQRKSKGGTVRLVVMGDPVEDFDWYDTYTPIGLWGKSGSTQNFADFAHPALLDPFFVGPLFNLKAHRLRVYAGQADPNDESHFTIAYKVNDLPDVIDGYLQDDGSVKIAFRGGASIHSRAIPLGTIQSGSSVNIPENTPIPFDPFSQRRSSMDLIDDNPRRR
jgi:hypothetical protein